MEQYKKKKVLFLASWYPSNENPTLGNFVKKHAEAANKIADVDVLYAISTSKVKELTISDTVINGVRTVVVYYPKIKNSIPLLSSIFKKHAYTRSLFVGFKHLNSTYDLAHLNVIFPAGLFALKLKNTYRIPYVATIHWTGYMKNDGAYFTLPKLVKNAHKRILLNAQEVLPVSNSLGKTMQELNLIKNFTVLPNIVNEHYFYPTSMDKTHKTIRFLHVSTFDEDQKNISGMLRTIAKLQINYHLHIITDIAEIEVWRQLRKYNIPNQLCTVESKVNAHRVGDAMRLADGLILFSNYETFSVVLAEAWSSGIPAIYSRCGGLTEINNPSLGMQIEVNNELDLLNALTNFSPNNYDSQQIVNFASQFYSERIAEHLNSIYDKVEAD